MSEDISLITELRVRIQELEEKVESLRISRRVLMNLIEVLEKEKREQLFRLETQNEKLQKNNCRYARAIMYRNLRITEMEEQLKNFFSST
jgi:TolA-binding protein